MNPSDYLTTLAMLGQAFDEEMSKVVGELALPENVERLRKAAVQLDAARICLSDAEDALSQTPIAALGHRLVEMRGRIGYFSDVLAKTIMTIDQKRKGKK